MQNSHFHRACENGLAVLLENPETFPADGVTLNFLVESELGCFIALKHALIRGGSDAAGIRPQ
jgi:hypothetical protein